MFYCIDFAVQRSKFFKAHAHITFKSLSDSISTDNFISFQIAITSDDKDIYYIFIACVNTALGCIFSLAL
jgi:hypothetical protein